MTVGSPVGPATTSSTILSNLGQITVFWIIPTLESHDSRASSQYPKRRLSVRSRKVLKPRDLYLELSDRSEIRQALRQQCCRCACQISKQYDNLKYQSRGFETLRDLTKRRLFGYWDGAQISTPVPTVLGKALPSNLYKMHVCRQ